MPDYVEYGAYATVPGPMHCTGATEWGFVLEADSERLATLCVRMFREPTGGEIDIRPLGRHVVLELGRIARITSATAPFDRMGSAAESQVCVWVPCARVREHGEHVVAEELLWLMPLICVDNPISLASGREMYGFAKTWGWIELPAEGAAETALGLDVFGTDFAPGAQPARRPLVRITQGEPIAPRPAGEWSHLADVARHLRSIAEGAPGEAVTPGIRLGAALAHDLLRAEVRQVFLKQVRAADDGTKAGLQQVVEIAYRLLRLRGRPLLHEHSVQIDSLQSHPLVTELGLRSQSTRLGYRIEADFDLLGGRVLWQAPSSA